MRNFHWHVKITKKAPAGLQVLSMNCVELLLRSQLGDFFVY
ncbi:MAG: hypothetical protein PWR20_254 [Bacteroidales bacterium]|jgi:hypothetical protein|nr:hypothetical protein [Bacteroidales bacterium]MDN5328384.1 hypothetical protein [Bacteroidales bacterium]